MNGKQYIQIQMSLIQMGQQASKLDLDGFMKAISNAETTAPIVDPTLYRRAADNLRAIKNLGKAAQEIQKAFAAMQEAVTKTAAELMAQNQADEDECNEHA